MNPDAQEVFEAYFGVPANLYAALAVLLFFVIGITWIIVCIKAFKEKGEKDKDDSDVLFVVARGLVMMLLITAVFISF